MGRHLGSLLALVAILGGAAPARASYLAAVPSTRSAHPTPTSAIYPALPPPLDHRASARRASPCTSEIQESASGVSTTKSLIAVDLGEPKARQLLRQIEHSCDPVASGTPNNPVNNRDPTGRFIPLIAACALNPVCAGAVIGAGVAAYAQVADLFTSGHLRTNAEIATGLGVGAAAGVVGVGAGALAATGATSLGLASGSVATGLLGSAAGGAAGGSTARLLSGEDLTVETVATDAVVGMATYGVLRGGTALANAGRSIGTSPYPAAYDDVVESLRSGGGPLPPEGIGATAVVGPRVSQKQLRHVLDRPEWLARGRGSYFRSVADAQRVLDAYHSGNAKVLGRTKAGHVVVKYDDVTGYNTNRSAGFEDQPTNVFMLKGTAAPSVVPTSPRWSPSNSVEP